MAKALASSLEPKSRDWVPLFIAFATVRGGNSFTDAHSPTHTSPDSEADSDLDSDSESDPVTPAQPQSSTPLETTLQPELTQAVKSKVIGSTHKRQQQQGRDGIHVGAKAWRNQLKEWLGFVGGIKGAKGVFRSEELKQCVVKQLQDTDSGVQQAALRSLQVHTHSHTHSLPLPTQLCMFSQVLPAVTEAQACSLPLLTELCLLSQVLSQWWYEHKHVPSLSEVDLLQFPYHGKTSCASSLYCVCCVSVCAPCLALRCQDCFLS
jgi:hypothetical protein